MKKLVLATMIALLGIIAGVSAYAYEYLYQDANKIEISNGNVIIKIGDSNKIKILNTSELKYPAGCDNFCLVNIEVTNGSQKIQIGNGIKVNIGNDNDTDNSNIDLDLDINSDIDDTENENSEEW